MGLKDNLKTLVEELNRVHSGAISWNEEFDMPDFVTATNGMQRHFTRNARKCLQGLAYIIHINRSNTAPQIELAGYEKILRQVVADLHAENEFDSFSSTDDTSIINKLKTLTEERIAAIAQEYTHYFPAWTAGMENCAPYILGPVTFLTRNQWIDSVDFSNNGKDRYLNKPEANYQWKESLKYALQNSEKPLALEGLAAAVYKPISQCPSLLKVSIRGYEKEFSRKLARLVCKTALDAISLGLGSTEFFHQQALQEERLPPTGTYSLLETNGNLWLPGRYLGKRIPHHPPERVNNALADMATILSAFASILGGLVNPSEHKHLKLANRWATALDWFGEGNRENSDAVALTKLGTSLDVLSCGGKYAGIAQMVRHLTGTGGDTTVIQEPLPLNLNQLVKDIYDDGRSKILHGTYFDRLESFALQRERAAYLGRIVLIESALRLHNYTGKDEEKAFRTIPEV